MPQYQLEVSVALVSAAVCSIGVFLLTGSGEGKIQLPTDVAEDDIQRDPFDLAKPEDLVDGIPVDEEGFWKQMYLRKLLLTAILAVLVIVQSVSLGWAILEEDRISIVAYSLHIVVAFYTLLLAGRAIGQRYGPHARSVVHLFGVTFVASGLLFATSILPASLAIRVLLSGDLVAPDTLWYAALLLWFAAFLLAITMPRGPPLYFPLEKVYSARIVAAGNAHEAANVCGVTGASVWNTLLFSYTTKVVMLGHTATSLEIADLPVVPANMRAVNIYTGMRAAMRRFRLRVRDWRPKPGSGWELMYRVVRVNAWMLSLVVILASVAAVMFYVPAYFLQLVIAYLEADPERKNRGWGWVYCAGLFFSEAITQLITGQLWSLSTTELQVRVRIQLNSILFAKTLVRKDIASSASATPSGAVSTANSTAASEAESKKDDEDDFSSKAQIMTLMTTDVDRVSEFSWHLFTLVDSPIELIIGTIFLYKLLGVSCFFGLAVTCLFLPLNHFASKVVVGAQDKLMKARDERVSLMNEILGGIRMLKFMAWERSFEKRVMAIRARELKYQQLNYHIEVLFSAIWNASPILVTLVSFWHFTVIRGQILTPSIAFTSISVFNEMKFALNALPETFINMLQSLVSVRRIEKYLNGAEIVPVTALSSEPQSIALQSATITWPTDRARGSNTPSAASTPRGKFVLVDLTLNFPSGELSLVCGKLGSGKSLLLLGLLGEADLLAGQMRCPRTPPDVLARFSHDRISGEEWIVQGICAYVPQSAWLRNASIRENILFELPYDEERYQQTLEACALLSDFEILEDGDQSEIGERGVGLSGGQKARVSLARAVYSRASILFLDDVLSAVDAHTAHHLFHQCLKGDLMRGRTIILVSHHVQLCAPGAGYIVALDNGRLLFAGDNEKFGKSGVLDTLVQSGGGGSSDDKEEVAIEHAVEEIFDEKHVAESTEGSDSMSTSAPTIAAKEPAKPETKKAPRKIVEEEKRSVGRISWDVWRTYLGAAGGYPYRTLFLSAMVVAAIGPVFENGWLRIWTSAVTQSDDPRPPMYYIGIYAVITTTVLILWTIRWVLLYHGGIQASTVLYQRLLESVLFANIRFHDTISRGRLLNRFGKDFEGIDSTLPDNFGRSVAYALSAVTTFVTISVVGGLPFVAAAVILIMLYYNAGRLYGQTARDMRRLESVTASPLYSIYGEAIAGVTVLRAFGASSKLLRDMLRCVDTNSNPYYWRWGVNRWLSARFNLLSSAVVGITAVGAILTPSINASLAGFTLAFASTVTNDLLFMVRRFVGLEQSMVAVERIKEYSELKREPPEFIEPRPPASWPERGTIQVEDLVIRYAPELPAVLHGLSFTVRPGEKVGVLGRTGSGKSTLALSFFRFVEPAEGRILVDDVDIATLGLTDLRSRLTIIPQDPTILSGTLRTMLDVFDEYEDAEIYEALRRVHLIPSEDEPAEDADAVNANVFRSLDSPVSEGGDNFSTGEKQLLCMARAILKRSKVLLMDEATASVDYATDELIGKTIRQEFAESTILTIAHRLRTVIDYDRIMLLDQGRIVEFDAPATLLADPNSRFHALCKATGKSEFAMLKRLAGVA